MTVLLLIAVMFLAATNGANDNFKGVATLYGSRTTGYWTSLIWASVTTFAGALASAYLAKTLLMAFTGAGLVPAAVAADDGFAAAVAMGAGITVALAAWRGLPISTTHALVGAMSGAGLMAAGSLVRFGTLGGTFLLPLLVSPVIAMVPAMILTRLFRPWLARIAKAPSACVCETQPRLAADGTLAFQTAGITLGTVPACERADARPLLRVGGRRTTDAVHFLLAGAVGFARGLNDTPKMAALLVPIAALSTRSAVSAVAAAIVVGGLIGARRVARTMSERITDLDLAPALAASLTTSLLVSTASMNGLPVSTTHVAVGALTGAGAAGRGVNRNVLGGIAFAWLVTLPVGAAFGALVYGLLH